jgi:hypothetical protein
MDNNAERDRSLLASFFRPLRAALALWRRSRHAALAAGRTYENARGAGTPHDAAAEAAFKVLTKEERPSLPDVASVPNVGPGEASNASSGNVTGPAWPTPQGSS